MKYLLLVGSEGLAAAHRPPGTMRSRCARSRTDDKPAAQRAPGTAFRDERGRAAPAATQTRAICAHEPPPR
jgi:hypothetical protein